MSIIMHAMTPTMNEVIFKLIELRRLSFHVREAHN